MYTDIARRWNTIQDVKNQFYLCSRWVAITIIITGIMNKLSTHKQRQASQIRQLHAVCRFRTSKYTSIHYLSWNVNVHDYLYRPYGLDPDYIFNEFYQVRSFSNVPVWMGATLFKIPTPHVRTVLTRESDLRNIPTIGMRTRCHTHRSELDASFTNVAALSKTRSKHHNSITSSRRFSSESILFYLTRWLSRLNLI